MMELESRITMDGPALRAFSKGRMAAATRRAARKAASTSARDMKSEAVKRVRASKRIKVRAIRKAIVVRKNRGRNLDDMEWGLDVRGGLTRLIDYPGVRQTKKGVVAEITRGRKKLYKGAFIATMKTGHKGVFKRKGDERNPIEERLATRPIGVLRKASEHGAVTRRGRSSFSRTFDALLPIELDKVGK